jgi:SpoIID/LytB domain protein
MSRRILMRLGGAIAAVALMLFPAASSRADEVGRPSGSKAAPYLPTTSFGAPSTTLNVAPGRVLIDGKGFGHGVGLAQDGAFWMGKAGKDVGQILALFFPGTALSKRGGAIRVPLSATNSATVGLPSGGTAGSIKVASGGGVRLVAGNGVVSASLTAGAPTPVSTVAAAAVGEPPQGLDPSDSLVRQSIQSAPGFGRFVVPIPEVPTTSPPEVAPTLPVDPALPVSPTDATSLPISTIPPAGENSTPTDNLPADNVTEGSTPKKRFNGITGATIRVTAANGGVITFGSKRYRGSVDFIAGNSGMRVVNELDVELYLRGMAEVTDPRWPAAAMQAQAVVARTYALRMMGTRGEVCPTQACQVYVGAQAEYPEMNAAVAATAGKVVTYQGDLANTFYSASGGGTIADPAEVFGEGKPIPYLQAGTYPTGDPKAWHVELSMAELGRRVGYPGTLFDVYVSKVGPSGRAVEVTFSGSRGLRSMKGPKFDKILGLRSTNFRLVVGRSGGAPTTTVTSGAPVEEIGGNGGAGSSGDSPIEYQTGLLYGPPSTSLLTSTSLSTSPGPAPSVSNSVVTTVPSSSASIVTSAERVVTERVVTTVAPVTTREELIAPTTEDVSGRTEAAVAADRPDTQTSIDWGSLLKLGGGVVAGGASLLWALRWAMRSEV